MNKSHFQKNPVRQGENTYFRHFTDEKNGGRKLCIMWCKFDPRTQSLVLWPRQEGSLSWDLSFRRLGSCPPQNPSLPKGEQSTVQRGHATRVPYPKATKCTFQGRHGLPHWACPECWHNHWLMHLGSSCGLNCMHGGSSCSWRYTCTQWMFFWNMIRLQVGREGIWGQALPLHILVKTQIKLWGVWIWTCLSELLPRNLCQGRRHSFYSLLACFMT